MEYIFNLLTWLLLALQYATLAADALIVSPPAPGLAASENYSVRVRSARDGAAWQDAFAWETVCKRTQKDTDGYFDSLARWTHIYVNCETAGSVEVESARVNGRPIRFAAVHPKRKASACSVKDGKAYVRLDHSRIGIGAMRITFGSSDSAHCREHGGNIPSLSSCWSSTLATASVPTASSR